MNVYYKYGWVLILLFLIGVASLLDAIRPVPNLAPLVTKTITHSSKEAVRTGPLRLSEAVVASEYQEPIVVPDPPKPVATVASVAYPGGCNQYVPLLSNYRWDVHVALAVMRAESSCNNLAENKTDNHKVCKGSRGLFQIGCDSTPNYGAMFTPVRNGHQFSPGFLQFTVIGNICQ